LVLRCGGVHGERDREDILTLMLEKIGYLVYAGHYGVSLGPQSYLRLYRRAQVRVSLLIPAYCPGELGAIGPPPDSALPGVRETTKNPLRAGYRRSRCGSYNEDG
jgi:hypothetical protein